MFFGFIIKPVMIPTAGGDFWLSRKGKFKGTRSFVRIESQISANC